MPEKTGEVKVETKTIGGHKLRWNLYKLEQETGKKRGVKIGFLSGAKYPNGQQVAEVALYNEFGTDRIPERPFFRRAISGSRPEMRKIQRKYGREDRNKALGLIGAYMQGRVQTSISEFRRPPNAPSTIEAKGSSKPLIDTGTMRTSVAWEIMR